jgi:recombinational DNA repair protein RecR
MADIVKFPRDERRAAFRLLAQQRQQLLRAFDRIETPQRRAKAVETCVMLGILDRCVVDKNGD